MTKLTGGAPLELLFQENSIDTLVIGIYLFPHRLFGDVDWKDAYSATAVIGTVQIEDLTVMLTANGGLCVRPPRGLLGGLDRVLHLRDKLQFQERAAELFNRVIAEFCFLGVVSEPATAVHVARGAMIDEHAVLPSASGGREMYTERSIAVAAQLISGDWRMTPRHPLEIALAALRQERTSFLAPLSPLLPTLVAQAYFLFSRRQLGEALADIWVVIEQILDFLWDKHLSTLTDTERRQRLKDHRTYSAAVRIELLQTAGVLAEALCQELHRARKHRNELAHRAKVTLEAATEAATAMKRLIEFFSGKTIEPLLVSESVGW